MLRDEYNNRPHLTTFFGDCFAGFYKRGNQLGFKSLIAPIDTQQSPPVTNILAPARGTIIRFTDTGKADFSFESCYYLHRPMLSSIFVKKEFYVADKEDKG